jgi:hypothetical protein
MAGHACGVAWFLNLVRVFLVDSSSAVPSPNSSSSQLSTLIVLLLLLLMLLLLLLLQGECVPVPSVPAHQLRGPRRVHMRRVRPQPVRALRAAAAGRQGPRLPHHAGASKPR